ncbi:serine/threonine protein kinase [Streptomyces sp. SPB074]|nr:serine/threonine protein kinase [Streptomyces sp. SPB074]
MPDRPRASLKDVVPRRTLVVIAAVVVLAVIATVVFLVVTNGGDEDKQGAKAATTPSTSARSSGAHRDGGKEKSPETSPSAQQPATSREAGADGGKSEGGGKDDDAKDKEKGGGKEEDGKGDEGKDENKGGAPLDVTNHQDPTGFSIGLPDGWKRVSSGAAGVRFAGPAGQRLLIGTTTTPKSDAVADWQRQERSMVRPNYHRLAIKRVDYRGWETADWEFTYTDGGTRMHSVDRGTVVNSHRGYGLMFTAKDADWDSTSVRDTWQTFTETFKPAS